MTAAPPRTFDSDPADGGAAPGPGPGRRRRWHAAAAPIATAALLLAATAYGLTLPRPGDADPFHARVAAAAAETPYQVGPYRGRDATVAVEAVELLRPNLIISRSFLPEGPDAGEASNPAPSPWVQLLVVQCHDARDILGHWPPVCYEANGFTPGPVEDADWVVDGRRLSGRRYRFHKSDELGGRTGIVVANFLVLPNGRVVRDMAQVSEAGGDYRLRYFGAAQVQVLTPEEIGPDARRDAEQAFLEAHAGLIEAMASGVVPASGSAPLPAPA